MRKEVDSEEIVGIFDLVHAILGRILSICEIFHCTADLNIILCWGKNIPFLLICWYRDSHWIMLRPLHLLNTEIDFNSFNFISIKVMDIMFWNTSMIFDNVFTRYQSLGMRPANKRRCCNVMASLIGWAHTQSDPCCHRKQSWDYTINGKGCIAEIQFISKTLNIEYYIFVLFLLCIVLTNLIQLRFMQNFIWQ